MECPAALCTTAATSGDVSDDQKSSRALAEAMVSYRGLGAHTLSQAPVDALLWAKACDFIDVILEGVCRHLPSVKMSFAINDRCDPAGVDAGTPALPALEVSISPAGVFGEITTRSRVGINFQLAGLMRFTPQLDDSRWGRALTISVDGLSSKCYEDALFMRARLEQEVGEDFTPAQALRWYHENKDRLFPLESSKMRRFIESVLGRAYSAAIPRNMQRNLIAGFANGRPREVVSFAFCAEGAAGVRISATQSAPSNDKEARMDAECARIAFETLSNDRWTAEMLAPSSINFLAMFFGHEQGQPGGDPQKVLKLFTGASSWGPGSSGWQRFDRSWLCQDHTDALGRVVAEQGRLIWHLPGWPATGHAQEACEAQASPDRGRAAASQLATPSSKAKVLLRNMPVLSIAILGLVLLCLHRSRLLLLPG